MRALTDKQLKNLNVKSPSRYPKVLFALTSKNIQKYLDEAYEKLPFKDEYDLEVISKLVIEELGECPFSDLNDALADYIESAIDRIMEKNNEKGNGL